MSRFSELSSRNACRRLTVAVAAGLAAGAGFASRSYANSYASNVTVTGGTSVSFLLNENADALTYTINGGSPISIPATKGAHTFSLGAPTDTFSIVAENSDVGYTSTSGGMIQPEANGVPAAVAAGVTRMISSDTSLTAFNSPRGVSVSLNPNAPNFGTAYIANSAAGTVGTRTLGDGIYALHADQSDAYGYGDNAQNPPANPGDGFPLFSTGSTSSPYRTTVAPNGDLYVADWADVNSNVFRVAPDLTAGQPMFASLNGNTPLPAGQNHGSISSVFVSGSIATGDVTIWGVDEDLTDSYLGTGASAANFNSLWRWNVGNNTGGSFNGTPTRVSPLVGATPATQTGPLLNANGLVTDMDKGADGKFYMAQSRTVGTEAGVVVLDASGNNIWDSLTATRAITGLSTSNDFLRNVQGMAVSADQKFLAIVLTNSDVEIVPLVNGLPDLANRRVVDTGFDIGNGRDIAFDAADNIHYVSSGQGVYRVLSPGGHSISTTNWDGSSYSFNNTVDAGTVHTLYWDTNGATPGSGGPAPSGNWDGTTTNFTADSTGSSGTLQANVAGLDVVNFAAGGDGTGTYTVTVSGAQHVGTMNITQGNVSFTGGTIRPNEINVSTGAAANVSSLIDGGFTKTGAGQLTISGSTANGAPGLVYINGGEIVLNKTGVNALSTDIYINSGKLTLAASDQILDGQNVTLGPAAATTFDLGASHNETVNIVSLDGNGTITGTGTSTLTGTYDFRNGTADVILAGTLRTLTKTTSGTVTLTKANTYTGATTITAGTLSIGTNTSLGTGTVTFNGGALKSSSSTARTLANNAVINANSSVSGTGAITINGTFTNSGGNRTLTSTDTAATTLGGNVFLSEAAATGRTLTLAGASSVNPTFLVSGNIANASAAGAGIGNLTIGGTTAATASTVTLSGTNTYGGVTTVNTGSLLKIGSTGALPSTTTLTFGGNGSFDNTTGATLNLTNNLNLSGGSPTFVGTNNINFGNNTVSINANRTITTTAGTLTVGAIAQDATPRTFTKAGAGNLVLLGTSTYLGTTTVSAGGLILGNGGTTGALAAGGGAITVNGNLTFNRSNAVTQGTDFSASAIGGTGSLTQAGSGTLTLNAANTYAGGTTVSAGSLILANADATGGGAITVANGALAQAQAALPKAVTVSTLNTNTTGKFDLTDNSMVVRGMTVSQVGALVKTGFAGGAWNGTGINSSTAAASTITAVGFADNSILNKTLFKGVSVGPTDVLVKYTYYGDADLSGATTLDDFTLFLNGYQTGGTTWVQGDFDNSGTVTLDDFTLFLGGYQNQGAPLSALEALINATPMSSAERSAMLAAVEAVPEPGCVGAVGLLGLGLARRRRRLNSCRDRR